MAVFSTVPDDGKTPDGKPKVLKKAMGSKGKKGKPDLDELKQEVDMVSVFKIDLFVDVFENIKNLQ